MSDQTETPPVPSAEPASASPERLASSHYENFAVLSPLLSAERRDAFATVYAYCRGLDDTADVPIESGTDPSVARRRALDRLARWRHALDRVFSGEPLADTCNDPAYRSAPPALWTRLAALAERHDLDKQPFVDLIAAFERDQTQSVYQTLDDLLTYCAKSADPVGRIILRLIGIDPADGSQAGLVAASDRICSALQLANHWQDVRKDLLDLGRVYLPVTDTGLTEDDLRGMAATPHDADARVRFIKAVRPLIHRTRSMFDDSRSLPADLIAAGVSKRDAGAVWLFHAGGLAAVRSVERVGCATLWEHARVSRATKLRLLASAWVRFGHGQRRRQNSTD